MDSHEIPLSHGQKALWFLQRLRPDSAAWNIAAAARIRGRDQGRLDAGRLRRAFERLTERHEALRLSFHETPDGPVQRLREAGGLDFREEEWEEGLLQGEAERPFDLEKDPLLRVRLLRTGEDDILLLVIHHLVADLGSLAVIVRELGPLYEGAFDDPPPVPYSAFVWRERLKERHWEYWRKRLGGELPVCELPADRPRPAVRSFRGGSRTRRIGLELPASRVFPFLVAGLDVLLHRASGQTDLLVGSPMSGRLAPELDGTVGYLVNPVVLRSDLSGSPTFGQLLEQVRGVVLGALRRQEYPFPLLVERLQPERDPARPPVFQVMLAFQRAHLRGAGDLAAFALGIAGAVVRTGPLVLESLPLERRSSQLDLELMAAETSRGLELALTFNADLFEPATAERLLGHLVALLEAAAENPERRIGELPLLGPAERQQLLEWNDTAFPLPDRSVPELFEEQAARSPDAPAVDGMSYRELSERSDEVARSLAGLSPEEPVAVLLERGTGLAVALLGILKAGGVYLPLNPSHPEARRARMLELSGAGRVLDVGAGLAPAREGVNPSPTSRVAGTIESLAYLLFTSGSTGDPKGALVPHRGLLNHLLAKIQDLGLSPADRVGQTAPQSFDIHIWQLLAPLLAGARVEVLPDETVGSPGLLKAEVERRGITVLELVPSLIGPLLDQAGAPSGLRWLISTGEALSPELARRWLSTGVPLVNGYGPTECADRVSHAFLGEIPEHAVHTSIGRPIPNLRPHVLSPDLEPQPIGFPGEICIAGAGVGRGYLDDPAGTAAAFVPDPFEPGGRLYRTGDLGRCRPDGEIEVLGRLDEQVKLRGVRIEPGEIEAALAAHPGVREAVVALRGGRLAAWWTGDPATPATPSELREHLLQRLPLAMVPALFQRLDALPLTPHGKIDRRALPDPAPDAPAGDDSPGDGMEQLLAGIFGAVLGREGIGPQDDFFGLGGHSLLAAQVATRVRQALGIELPLNVLFEQPTAAGLARRLRSLTGVPSSSMPCAPREERLPLSFAQQGLWFLHRLAPDSPVYNMPGLVRLPGSLDPAASRAALSAIVARHEALRTTFPTTGGEPYQEIGPAVPIAIPVVDLSALPDADREARRLASEEGRRPFDLARGPLLRALLLRLGPEEQRLLVVLHHIVADGWSLGVLAREMSALLRGEALPELAVQYADYACWQRRWPAEILDRQLAWWTGRLAGLTPLDLPTDRPRPAAQSFRGGLVSAALPALPRDRRATPFLQLLAAWQVLLHRLTGQSDVAVGSPAANRRRPETEGLVGLFANTLVLRTDLSEEPDFAGALAQVREAALLAQAHQDLPFERLVSELAPERDLSRPPLVQMAFSFEEALPPLDLGEGRQGGIEELHPGTSRLDLWLRVEAGEEGWRARAEYAADLFDEATVRRWLGHLQTLLEGIAPDVRISELPLLSPAEIAELTSWNRTAAEIPEEPVHRLFLRQAERAPDALAVEWPGGRLTYGELARRAGRLAGRLSGVGPETVVALRMERSPELIIAALGTLLAGGAYLPIDPTNPEERARWILEDSGALLELTALPENGDMPPPAAFDPDLLAYVIYTSGSTGTPKGTELRHRGLSSLIAWHVRTYGLGPSDRTTLLAGPGFDASVWETWAALACGASLHLPPAEAVLSPPALLAWMAEQRITVSFLPTPVAEAVLAEPLPAGLALRCLLTGGDLLRLRPAPGLPFDVINHYGPTESTVVATAGRVAAERATEGKTAPGIGSPVANTRVHVVDRNLRSVPAGVAGELCLAGEGLARAYRGRPGLTAERFVPNPFGEGERLYRTGDLARWLPEGNLQFLGRIDHQVKIRGFRIEPGEIEAVLRQCPGVREAAVVVRGDRLVAYHVPEQEPGRLREWLRGRLPEVMVPATFVPLHALPLTPSGKIDRRALPDPAPAADEDGAPLGPIEETVAEIWAGVLGVERIGRHRGFFELGGHSLHATRVMSRVNQVFGTDLPLRALFEAPTVAGLARLVASAARDPLPMPELRAVPRGQSLALSFAQERLWVLDQLVPGSPVYNVFAALELNGPLDEAALERAFSEAARRHETLRTRFAVVHGRPAQVVEPHRPRPLPVVDLRALPPLLRQEEADRLADREARRPFDLLRGPLLRFGLLRLGDSSRLLLNLHHIVCDGWSLDLLAREVGALYRGQTLPELPFQYADYADWQRRWPAELLDGQLAWWTERLAGLATLELPTDRPRPPVQSFRGGLIQAALPPDLAVRLRQLARERNATPFLLLLAAWQTLLHRLTGQEDVAVGTPVANRNRPQTEGLVGFFANTLVLRADLSREPGFLDALERIRETALSAFSRQDLPFERLVAERDLSRPPLFQVAFSFQESPPRLDLGVGSRILTTHTGTAKFDLDLQMDPERLRAEYAADLFDAATVRRWLRHLRTLLEGIAAAPEARISDLPLLSPAERHHLLLEWNDTGGSPEATIHQLVEEQASRTPDAVAVVFGDERLTYAELNARADGLADRLLALGVQPGACVALLAERSPEMIVALLAILKAGAAYAPLDPELPAERLAFLVDDLRPPVVLAQERLLPRLPACGAAVVRLEDDLPAGPRLARPAVLADSPAYVLYTSGSTGRPKGVTAVHRGVVRLVRGGGFADLGPARTLLQLAPLSFDASTLEIWGALANGGRLAVFPPGVPDFQELAETIARHGVDTLWLTAALFHQVVGEKPAALLPVRQLLVGGDVLSPAHVRKAFARRPGGVVINGYGPTESTTFACCHTMRSAEDVGEPVSLGRPVGGTRCHVLDRNLRPVPRGVPGELFLGGDGLARGYHRRPDLTAERFVPDPFGEGERLYRTGDLARWLPEGNLQFLGRIDHQVKIRGFRIEPGEIEAVLRQCPGVREAAVVVRGDRLVAYHVPEQEPGRLREWLRGRLPEVMVPAAFVPLHALPLTPGGKIDRRALPDPAPAADEDGAPLGPIEETVAEIWAGVLGVERIGRHRGFFDLGGHSLHATRVMSRVNQVFGTDLPLRALFEAPTVAGLARLVSSAARDRFPMPAFRRVPRDQPLAPSFAQERLWVMDQLIPGSPVYNVFQALDLSGPLDETALERALIEAARRHEALRTRFAVVQGRPVQVVEPHRPRPLPVVDLRALPPLARREEADRLADQEARRPFDLLRGPLLRSTLLRLGEASRLPSSRLLLNLHHIVCDGWSLDLLAREVGALYRGQTLPELPFQYADYADWQRRWPAELLDGQLAWWKERLAGLSTLEIPTDLPRPAVRSFRGGLVLATLPPGFSARLRLLARERHATLFMLLLAAWQILLHRITGQEDVAVGAPVANRNWPEIEGLVGFFANNLVLRTDLSQEPGFGEALERVRETALAAFSRQDLPFERLVAELAPRRDLSHASRSPLFQVAFSLEEAPVCLDPGLGGRVLATHTGTSKFDLGLQVEQDRLRAEYAADLFDAATVRRWLGHLRVLLAGIAESPETRIRDLPLLSQAERHQLRVEWNDTGPAAGQATIPRLVEEQAARTPDAVAVVFGDERLTYAELNARADALADRLLALGVRPEERVAVVMERSPELVVSLLAILKSGAAYAPLDPGLPAERLAFLLRDLRPAVVLPLDAAPGLLPAAPRPAVLPEGLAYVLHTSGSTGEPKPVGVSHAVLAQHILAAADRLELGERDRALVFASPAFDVSLEQLLTALVRGAAVVLRGAEVWPPADFSRIAGELGLTVAELPTAYWRQWVREPAFGAPTALRLVTAGGEAMPAEDARLWLRSPLAGVRLLNAYGPTEGVITATFQEVDAAAASRPGAVTLGRPLPGRRACVLDRLGQLQPPGAPGELCLGGPPLARGYLGWPDLTAERFVPDPGAPEPGARLYRTGDLVRRLPDGNLQFLGRIDRQVKIRGFRVEMEEVETVLRRHPGVREAVVVMREDRLVGYYVPGPEPGPETAPDQVRAWLRGKLPEPLVPAAFVPLGALPRTPGGKIDRRALPAPVSAPVAPAAAPRTPLESLVAGVCSEVLGMDEVPRDVSFFDLGGNSLLATQVVTLLQDVLPVELNLRQILERPTVARIAEIVEEGRHALPGPEQLAMDEILAELERSL